MRQVAAVLNTDLRGVFHACCHGDVTWYRFACDIFEIMKMQVLIRPCTTAEFPRPAPRPARSTLDNSRLRDAGLDVMRDYREALAEFLTRPL